MAESQNLNDHRPLYLVIQHDIERAIMSGEWPPGSRVPSEHALLEQYACSRMTVNKALSALAAAGLIIRKRRSGSFVAAPQSEETILEIHDIREEIVASGKSYRYELLDSRIRRASALDARRLGIEIEAEVVAIQARHFAGGRAFVIEDRLINLAAVPQARDERFTEAPAGTWLLAKIPWSEGEQKIRAVVAGSAIAARLDVDKSEACLVVERRTWQMGVPVTTVKLTYPGDRHQLVARIRPDTPALAARLERKVG